MDHKDFKRLNEVCKKGWIKTSKNARKDITLRRYRSFCPACELAYHATVRSGTSQFQRCIYCPIRRWRIEAQRGQYFPCENLNDSPYDQWEQLEGLLLTEEEKDLKKRMAVTVANLKWSYLPIYRKIPSGDIFHE